MMTAGLSRISWKIKKDENNQTIHHHIVADQPGAVGFAICE
jgi:hypothetical protein